MRVGIYLFDISKPTAGGGFSYAERLIEAIDLYQFDSTIEICFIGRMPSKKINFKKSYYRIAPFYFYLLFFGLERFKIFSFFYERLFINLDLCNRIDQYILRKRKIDLLVYPKQAHCEVRHFPFITMNWDLGHKTSFAFPEFIQNGSFELREQWYRSEIQKALCILCESQQGKLELTNYLSIPESKIKVVPLFAGKVVTLSLSEEEHSKILSRYRLQRHCYFFYPAQFWAHKNHYGLVKAFEILLETNKSAKSIKLVLTGSDKGNKQHILSVIEKLQLGDSIEVLSFVSNEEIYCLYKNSIALVMPTFLGPTNMPPLEAQTIGTVILCSDLAGHREMCADGAVYFNPVNPKDICDAMALVLDDNIRSEYISKATAINKVSAFTIEKAMRAFEDALLKFTPIRNAF